MKKALTLSFITLLAFFTVGFDFPPETLDAYEGQFRDSVLHLNDQEVFTNDSYPENFVSTSVNRATFLKIVLTSYFNHYGIENFEEEAQCFYEGDDLEEEFWTNYGFEDVKGDEWYADYACYAKNKYIIHGADGYLLPHEKVTLEEAAKIIVNTHLIFEGENAMEKGKKIWFQPYVDYLIEKRALPQGLTQIGEEVWRGEVAEMLYRLQNGITNKTSGVIFTAQQRDGSFTHSWWYKVDENDQLYFLDDPLGVDVNHFQYVGGSSGISEGLLYVKHQPHDFIDPDTYENLPLGYARDKNGIYKYIDIYNTGLVPVIAVKDLETFYPCNRDYGEDQYNGYGSMGGVFEKGSQECNIPETGIIEGDLSYPSHGIPPMEICAENIETGDQFCTQEHIEHGKYYYGKGYQIHNVPPGSYHVYAATIEKQGTLAYTQHVLCMQQSNKLSKDCPNHERIVVQVRRGDHHQNIDPWDFGH